jgi:hypothetical protein
MITSVATSQNWKKEKKRKEKKNLITLLTLQIQEPFHLSQYTPKQMDKKDVQMSGLVPNEQLFITYSALSPPFQL